MTKIRIEFEIPENDPYDNEALIHILGEIGVYFKYTCKVVKDHDEID